VQRRIDTPYVSRVAATYRERPEPELAPAEGVEAHRALVDYVLTVESEPRGERRRRRGTNLWGPMEAASDETVRYRATGAAVPSLLAQRAWERLWSHQTAQPESGSIDELSGRLHNHHAELQPQWLRAWRGWTVGPDQHM
jgi:hypothetical protein